MSSAYIEVLGVIFHFKVLCNFYQPGDLKIRENS